MDVYFNSGSVPWAPIPHSELGENVPPHVNFRGTKYPVTKYYDGRMERPYQPGIPLNTVKCIVTGAPLGRLGHVAKTQSHMRPSHTKAMLGDKKLKVIDAKYKVLPAYQILVEKSGKVDEKKALDEFYRAIRYVSSNELAQAGKTYRKTLLTLVENGTFSSLEIDNLRKIITTYPLKDIVGDSFLNSFEKIYPLARLASNPADLFGGDNSLKDEIDRQRTTIIDLEDEKQKKQDEIDKKNTKIKELEDQLRQKNSGSDDEEIARLREEIESLQKRVDDEQSSAKYAITALENEKNQISEQYGTIYELYNNLLAANENRDKLLTKILNNLKGLKTKKVEDVEKIMDKWNTDKPGYYYGKVKELFRTLNIPEVKTLLDNIKTE